MPAVYHDITLGIRQDMVVYPGDPPVLISDAKSISGGDRCNVSVLSLGSHTGTHIDAPKHFFNNGTSVDRLALDYFIGDARVIEIKDPEAVKIEELNKHDIKAGERILLKTRNSRLLEMDSFEDDYCYVEPEAAGYLADKGIKTLGFDYLTVEKYGVDVPEVHYRLLGQNIVIAEGLMLRNVKPGRYGMFMLPLVIAGGNGSPVRAVLAENTQE